MAIGFYFQFGGSKLVSPNGYDSAQPEEPGGTLCDPQFASIIKYLISLYSIYCV